MEAYTHYCIYKTYSGFFTKKHAGNVHLIFCPLGTEQFGGLTVLGLLKDFPGTYATELLVLSGLEMMDSVISGYKQRYPGNFINLESLPSTSVRKQPGIFDIKLKKKGKYINSNMDLSFQPEYSQGDTKIYFLKAKLTLEFSEVVNQANIRMVSMKKKAVLSSLFSKIKG